MSWRQSTTLRRRALQKSTSSRRLSSVVNPDLLNDVTFYTIDEFSRTAPVRRHSIASLGALLPRIAPRKRATSETVSKRDTAALLEEWRDEQLAPKAEIEPFELGQVAEEEDEEVKIPSSSWRECLLITGVFMGYVLSSGSLQKLNSLSPGCGQLVTLLQYIATIGEKAPNAKAYIRNPVLPLYWHALFVVLMFLSVQMGNAALGAGLPFGLYLVIKNTNLVFSLVLGLVIGQSFTAVQILSIATVTAGVSSCVLAQQSEDEKSVGVMELDKSGGFVIGAVLCALSTFCMATLGSVQEYVFARYKDKGGQEAGESLFFTHLLGLPLFAVGDGVNVLLGHLELLWKTPCVTASMLALNIVCAVVLKQCFVELLEDGSSLTATLAITVGRMVSVVVSEIVLASHGGSTPGLFWLGALMVAAGSLSYALGGRLIVCSKEKGITNVAL